MIKEFREFIQRGNVIDMAVGIVIGAAFTQVINSIVEGLLMPIIGFLTAGIDFSEITLKLGEVVLQIGTVINAIISFLIVAFAMFIVVKAFNKLHAKEEVKQEVTTKTCPFCKTEIPIEASRCPNCTSELN
ncbi:MAG: large conductance mechanosensitive channel protein MscL [Tissierellia bacterium]|nr:large conductance mechanosensitive channel protein MscL [Tissierellia bacterium]